MNKRHVSLLPFVLAVCLLCGGLTDYARAQEDAVVVVADQVVAEVPPELYGLNLVGAKFYGDAAGGFWDSNSAPCAGEIVGCYAPSAYQLLADLRPGLLRFPGGRMTRSYDWQEGVGAAAQRTYLFGTDEFLFVAQRLDATPVFTVSLYDPADGTFASDDVFETAADWLAYVNTQSPYGPVTYWEVDSDTFENEANPFNPDVTYKRVAAEAYALAFLQMSAALKAVDPDILIGAVSYETKGIQETVQLLTAIAESGVDPYYWPDFLVMNFYRPNFDKNRCDLYGVDLETMLPNVMSAAFASSRELKKRLDDVIEVADEIWGEDKPDVPVLLSEYNTQLLFADTMTNYTGPGDPPECPFRTLRHSLGAALYNADVLATLLPYGDRLLGAAQWDFMDDLPPDAGFYGAAYRYQDRTVMRPNALAHRMLAHAYRAEQVLRTAVLTSTFDNNQVGRTPSYRSIDVQPSERYIRVRVVRHREPIENTPVCGPGNAHNPDPVSSVRGVFGLDNLSLKQDDVPPSVAIELLANGDFQEPLTTGWQVAPDPAGVTTERVCQGEECALSITFANAPGNNPAYLEQVMQTVEVTPGKRYRLGFDYAALGLVMKTQNLLCDPSWEYTSAPGPYTNGYWVQYGSTPAPATIITEDCEDGGQCVQVPIAGNPEYYHIRQQYPLADNANPELADPSKYHAVGYIKTENLDGPVTVEAQARNVADQLLQAEESNGLFGDADWTRQDLRISLWDRTNTAFLNVHLRRKLSRKDNGTAWFDDVRLYRDEYLYAPRLAVDICQDAACTVRRTVESDGVLGSREWTADSLSGTPLVKALASRRGEEVQIILINKDLERTLETAIDVSALTFDLPRVVLRSVLYADAVDAVNEEGALGPDIQVEFDGGEYFGDLDAAEVLLLDLPPHSITGLKIIDPSIQEDDPTPLDDDESPDDDTTPDDDDDGENGDDDDDDDGGCGC
jgi:hypothetical protein